MAKRDFEKWKQTFVKAIYSYEDFVDFDKVRNSIEKNQIEYNILNTLVGKPLEGKNNIEYFFEKIIKKDSNVLNCIPILLAKRCGRFIVKDRVDDNINYLEYNFKRNKTEEIKLLLRFMHCTGLFKMFSECSIKDVVSYVSGVEVGLDSNARKNRSGNLMENEVEMYLRETTLPYYKQVKIPKIEQAFGVKLDLLKGKGKREKKFDFLVPTNECNYIIEVNYYGSSGSKPDSITNDYIGKKKTIEEINRNGKVKFGFLWITDGPGWKSSETSLKTAFEEFEQIYNLNDLEEGKLKELFKNKANSDIYESLNKKDV